MDQSFQTSKNIKFLNNPRYYPAAKLSQNGNLIFAKKADFCFETLFHSGNVSLIHLLSKHCPAQTMLYLFS